MSLNNCLLIKKFLDAVVTRLPFNFDLTLIQRAFDCLSKVIKVRVP